MSSVTDHSGKLISQATEDRSLRHEPTRRSPEDAKRGGGRDGKAGRLTEVTDRGSRQPRKQTRNAPQRPVSPAVNPEDEDTEL